MPESNRSLERGLTLLDCFRPGVDALTHGELAAATGLAKATVSRLVQTLCACGYLVCDESARGYRLGVPVLSLARTHRVASTLLPRISPVIVKVAVSTASIVGIAGAHGTDMVYLEQVNGDPARGSRKVGAGQRLPIGGSAIGAAFLSGLGPQERAEWLAKLRSADRHWTPSHEQVVARSLREVKRHGHCVVTWNHGEHAAVAAPLRGDQGEPLAVNIGYTPATPGDRSVPAAIARSLQDLLACAGSALFAEARREGLAEPHSSLMWPARMMSP